MWGEGQGACWVTLSGSPLQPLVNTLHNRPPWGNNDSIVCPDNAVWRTGLKGWMGEKGWLGQGDSTGAQHLVKLCGWELELKGGGRVVTLRQSAMAVGVQEPWGEMWHWRDCWIGNHEDKLSQSFCRLNTVSQLWLVVKKMLHWYFEQQILLSRVNEISYKY